MLLLSLIASDTIKSNFSIGDFQQIAFIYEKILAITIPFAIQIGQ